MRIALWRQPNAIPLANALQPKWQKEQAARYDEVRAWLAESTADHAVISSEFFSTIAPVALQRALSVHVPDHADRARVIAYVRPHHSRFLAAFIQRTKTGALFVDIGSFLKNIQAAETLQYTRRFGRWRTQFGDRFVLRPFIRSELREQDAVTDFAAELLGETSFTLSETLEENVAVPVQVLAGMRLMQRRFKKAGVGDFGRAVMGGAMANYFLPMGPMHGAKPELDHTTAQRLISIFGADAQNLDEMFFGKPLMQRSLENCAHKSVNMPIDLTPERHFSQVQKITIIALSDEISNCFKERGRLWSQHHQIRKGQIKPSPEELEVLEMNQTYLQHIDEKMTELADVLRG